MKNAAFALALAGLAVAANAQVVPGAPTLNPGDIEYRIVADNTLIVPSDTTDRVVNLALQVRYVGGDNRFQTFLASRGRIESNEAPADGVLARSGVRSAPYGDAAFGAAAWQGMLNPFRGLIVPASANNVDQNGGNPNAPTVPYNTFNGGGEFRTASGNAGFNSILAFDSTFDGAGLASPTADGELSRGLSDQVNGDGTPGLEGDGSLTDDFARWDEVFLFTYTVTDLTARTISFDYQPVGSSANPGNTEDLMIFFDPVTGFSFGSNAAVGTFRDDLSDNIVVVPAPASLALVGLGGLVAARRRRA